MKSYKNKNYEQALIETFLKFDDILKTEKVNTLLKKYYNNNTLAQKYEFDMKISVNYLQEENLLAEVKNNVSSLDIREDVLNTDRSLSKIFLKILI